MNNRILLACLVVLTTIPLSSATCEAADNRPNIVFLMADDQCTYSLGCYGNADVETPNLDRLARVGMVFDNHYDTTAICMGSRANVLTGMFEYKTGCNFDHGPLLRSHWASCYPILLRKSGYLTAFAGKFGFVIADRPGEKGVLPDVDFDQWGGGPGQTSYETRKNKSMAKYAEQYPHSTLSYGAFGRDFIERGAKDERPFCLSISFKAPHRPVSPDPVFDQVYAGKTFKKPGNFGREKGEHFSRQSREGRQYVRFHEWKYSSEYSAVMSRYHQQIYAIDVAVGMIRQALDQFGVSDNTVIIYTSDNGFLCGSHGYGSKVLPYEEASRVPLIIYDPRQANSGKQLRCDALTGNVDFAPTILALADLPVPKHMDGDSLLPLYVDPTVEIHQSLPLINVWGPPEAHSLSVVTKDWKYIYWPFAEGDFVATEELYHTSSDPLELENCLQNPDTAATLGQLRDIFDKAVSSWKSDAVPYHNYRKYGTIFDRHLTWAQKSVVRRSLSPKPYDGPPSPSTIR
jgi:arylsulfatase A-like enzyme